MYLIVHPRIGHIYLKALEPSQNNECDPQKSRELTQWFKGVLTPILDLSKLGFIDKTALIFLSELAKKCKI